MVQEMSRKLSNITVSVILHMHLSYTGDSQSFLVYNSARNRCIIPLVDGAPDVTAQPCSTSNIQQHWIWTKYNQLLNLHALKCVQTSEILVYKHGFKNYPKVSLTSCNASDPKQIWECEGNELVYLAYEKAYLNYGNIKTYVIVFSGKLGYSKWTRYQAQSTSLCSSTSTYRGKSNRHNSSSHVVKVFFSK